MKTVQGNLIELAKQGHFDVIGHGCNCMSTMGAGLAPQMANAFGCDRFELELIGKDINKLGCIDYQTFVLGKTAIWNLTDAENNNNEPELHVVNMYTQYSYGRNHKDGVLVPFDYEAFTICLRKMNQIFRGKRIGLPKIGAGLAGGDWNIISEIIFKELNSCNVTIVNYKP